MWHLSSLTRDQTCVPCIGKWILNHWTTREVPHSLLQWNIFSICLKERHTLLIDSSNYERQEEPFVFLGISCTSLRHPGLSLASVLPAVRWKNQQFSNYAPWVLQGFFKHFSSNVLKWIKFYYLENWFQSAWDTGAEAPAELQACGAASAPKCLQLT